MSGKGGMKRILSQEYQSKYGARGNKSWTSGSDAQMVRLVMSASTSNLVTPHGDSGAALRRQKSILELTSSKQAADDLKKSVAAAEKLLKVTPLLMACAPSRAASRARARPRGAPDAQRNRRRRKKALEAAPQASASRPRRRSSTATTRR
jgi:hypothetical protein